MHGVHRPYNAAPIMQIADPRMQTHGREYPGSVSKRWRYIVNFRYNVLGVCFKME